MATRRVKKGSGRAVTAGEKYRYDQLRAAGWSPEASAEAIGRSTSWAYLYEKEKAPKEPDWPLPNDDLSEVVELTIHIKRDEEDEAFAIVDKYEGAVVPYLADLVWVFAYTEAGKLNQNLKVILADEPVMEELRAQPITPEEVLRGIPPLLRSRGKGQRFGMPPRAEKWLEDFFAKFDLNEIEEEIRQAMGNDRPEDALAAIRRRGVFEREEFQAPQNGKQPEPA